MKKLPIDQVIKRASIADDRKEQWRNIFEECYEFSMPQRNLYGGYYEGRVPGQNKMDRVFDSTAINSVQRFANRLQSNLFPPYRNWCRLESGNSIPPEQQEKLGLALDMYGETLFSVIRQTNFDLAMSEFLLDLCVGTGVMLIQRGTDDVPVTFEAIPQYLVSLEEGPQGQIDNVYRKLRKKAESIPQEWPDLKVHDDLTRIIEDKPTEEIDLLEATIYLPDSGYWCYHLIWPEKKFELVYRELDSSPWVVARYMKVAGEIYGRGPMVSALPDVKTLNTLKRMIFQNASIAVSGMYTAADDGVLNIQNIKIAGGAIIPVARNGGPQGESLKPLKAAGDFNVSQLVVNDLVVSIKRMLMDDTLPPDTMSARSATEVSARMRELASNMGAAFGRLITEAMIPIVSRILYVMNQENMIDLPLKIDGEQVKIVPVSPLAQAQNAEELESVVQFMQVAQQMGPAGQLAINQDKAIMFIADRLGIPNRILNSEEEKAEIMKQLEDAAAQAAEAEAAATAPEGEAPPEAEAVA